MLFLCLEWHPPIFFFIGQTIFTLNTLPLGETLQRNYIPSNDWSNCEQDTVYCAYGLLCPFFTSCHWPALTRFGAIWFISVPQCPAQGLPSPSAKVCYACHNHIQSHLFYSFFLSTNGDLFTLKNCNSTYLLKVQSPFHGYDMYPQTRLLCVFYKAVLLAIFLVH